MLQDSGADGDSVRGSSACKASPYKHADVAGELDALLFPKLADIGKAASDIRQ